MEIPKFSFAAADGEGCAPHPVALLTAWWKAAGADLARIASLRGVVNGRLQAVVPDAGWEREIRRHLGEILSRLRREPAGREISGIDLAVEP